MRPSDLAPVCRLLAASAPAADLFFSFPNPPDQRTDLNLKMRQLARDEPWAAPALMALDPQRRPSARSRSVSPPPSSSEDVRRFLSEADEREVLGVLREQYRHEQRITSDDVRFVVRAVASHGGAAGVPFDFPPARWILEFKRKHGFSPLGSAFAFGLPDHLNMNHNRSIARVSCSSISSGGSSDGERERPRGRRNPAAAVGEPGRFARLSLRPSYDSDSQLRRQQQQQQRRSMVVDDRRAAASWPQREHAAYQEELGSNTSSGSFDSENGTTTGDSSSSSVSTSAGMAPPSMNNAGNSSNSNNNMSGATSNYESSQDGNSASNEKRGYKLSHTVPAETWEKAIAAVEQQGMSLRAAAKIYGVHFAALHRRVKKRAQGGQTAKGNNGYFHPSDEAGIMRVVVARAELGVLMTFDELMKLVETAALRKLPDISVENARKLMVRFQSRNEQSIRHIIVDWPPPVPSDSGVSLYHLEHPGYDYGPEPSSAASMQRSFVAGSTDGTATAAAVAARVGSFSPTSGSRPVLPSMNVNRSPIRPPDVTMASPPQQQRVPRAQDSGRSHPVMFV